MPSDLNLGVVFAAVRLRNEFTPEMQKLVANAQRAGQQMQSAGRVLTLGITAPLVGFSAAAIKASIDFESSFAGVRKTVTATEPELQALSDGFRELALEIPTNVNELNKIGEAAGQLGIQTENILGFTETMAALGVTTNLSSEAAATSLARLANITGLQQDEFDNLGSAIVALGNNFATTESEIVDFGLRIAGAGELAGLSEGDILGIGTAMSSIGVQAEAGGTAVQKVLNEINQSVATGDKELRVFAEVAGMTAEQFAAAFREDAAGAFESFVTGLGDQGDRSFTIMEDLGLQSQRVIRAFLGLANSGDLLSEAMAEGNLSFEDNIALMIEAEQRYGTTESRLALLWSRVRELGITLGDSLIPAVHSFIDLAGPMLTFVTDAVKWWSAWPGPLKLASLAVVALVAAVGPALLIGGTLLTSWASIAMVFPVLAAKIGLAALAAKGFWIALSGPIGWTIAAFAAVGVAIFVFREKLGLVSSTVEYTAAALADARQKVEDFEGHVTKMSGYPLVRAKAVLKEAREELERLETAAAEADRAIESMGKSTLPSFAVTLEGAKAQLDQAERGLNQMVKAGMVADAEMEDWVDGLKQHVTALQSSNTASQEVAEGIEALVSTWTGAKFNVQEFDAAFGALTDEQRANTTIMGEVMSAYESARVKIGPFNDELERLRQAELRATDEASRLVDVSDLLGDFFKEADDTAAELAKELKALAKEAEVASEKFDRQREALLGLPTPKVKEDFERLQAVWASIKQPDSETTLRYAEALREAAAGGIELTATELAIVAATEQADGSLGNLEVTLAAIAGEMGGATGQGINLALSMMQVNDELEQGEKEFSNTQMAAAVLGGVLSDLASEVGGVAGEFLQAGANIATAFATGGPAAAAIAGIIEGVKLLGSWIDKMVNGAQMRFNDLTDAIVGSLSAIRDGTLTAAEAWDKATNWEGNEEGFERLRETQQLWVDAGLSAEEATVWAERFAEANRNQDATALQALLVEYEGVADAARAAREAAEEAAAAFDHAAGAAVGAFRSAQDAGADAYDSMIQASADYHAAVADGDEELAAKIVADNGIWVTSTEEAHARGTQAALAASAEVLAAKGVEYARTAAFDAAMALGAHKTSAERITAARAAATAAIESWDAAMVAVVESDEAANIALDETWNPETGDVVTDVEGTLANIKEAARIEFEDMTALAEEEASNINTALAAIDDVAVEVNYNYSHSGDPGSVSGGGGGGGLLDSAHGYAHGSGGQYIDFGRGSNVKLHGRERIVTEAEGRREAEGNAASLKGVEDRLDRLDLNLQRAIKRISTDVTNVVMTKSL